ncbi:MAG TPA: CDP-alcohol phosphatidyltransferase family protein [Chlamydiales bacterium]|nr:CDP-alcohol phosphatidyltransferase family protein [Chlamydiales bacterium]
MITVSNSLSFVRVPLAFLFLQENQTLRILAIILAMVTDSIDGYLARRSQSVSRFGAILDPAVDKFFVYFAMWVLFLEGKIVPWEMVAMLSRDFFVCLHGLLMLATGRWKNIVFRAIRWGKVTTALQFIILLALILNLAIPWYLYAAFVAMGWLAFLELFQIVETKSPA